MSIQPRNLRQGRGDRAALLCRWRDISMTQPFLSPFGAQPAGLSNATENRYTQSIYRISPYIRGTTPNNIDYELRNNSIWSNISSAPINTSNSYTSEWIGRIDTPVAPLGWSAYFSAVDIKYSDQASQRLNVATFGPRYAYDPQLRFSLIGGYEENRFPLHGLQGRGLWWRRRVAPGPTYERHRQCRAPLFRHRLPGNLSIARRCRSGVSVLPATSPLTPQELTTVTGTSSIPGLLNQFFTSRIPNAEHGRRKSTACPEPGAADLALQSGQYVFRRGAARGEFQRVGRTCGHAQQRFS